MSKHNKRTFNKYFIILCLGVIIWGVETAAFGFNAKPESGAESFWDALALLLMIFGAVGDLMRNVRITKSYHNVTNHRIHTREVKIEGDLPNVTTNQTFNVSSEAIKKLQAPKRRTKA